MAKTGWYKQLDKVSKKQQHSIPNTTPTHVEHPTEPPPITQPTCHHVQPGHEASPVCALQTQNQEGTCTFTHPHKCNTRSQMNETSAITKRLPRVSFPRCQRDPMLAIFFSRPQYDLDLQHLGIVCKFRKCFPIYNLSIKLNIMKIGAKLFKL